MYEFKLFILIEDHIWDDSKIKRPFCHLKHFFYWTNNLVFKSNLFVRFSNEDEVIEMANDARVGLDGEWLAS